MVVRKGGKERESQSFLAAEKVYSVGSMVGGVRSPEGLREESFLCGLRDKACFQWAECLERRSF